MVPSESSYKMTFEKKTTTKYQLKDVKYEKSKRRHNINSEMKSKEKCKKLKKV